MKNGEKEKININEKIKNGTFMQWKKGENGENRKAAKRANIASVSFTNEKP